MYGLARSGDAAAAALAARGDEIVRVDASLGNEDDVSLLEGVELLVKNPGVPGERPLVVEARRRGIPVWSEVELGYRLLRPRPFVGVTGTKGKTTTSTPRRSSASRAASPERASPSTSAFLTGGSSSGSTGRSRLRRGFRPESRSAP